MSELMQVFLNEFSVHHIRTSSYHPQPNGACERFNGTLKTMIRSLLDRFSRFLGHCPAMDPFCIP